jgi:HEAT repeat protein
MRASLLCTAVFLLALSCKKDPATPEYWAERLDDAKARKERQRVLEELRRSKFLGAAVMPVLVKQFQSDKSLEVKADIARILGEQKSVESVDALTAAVDVGSSEAEARTLNKEIANALTRIKEPKAIPVLKQLLNTRDGYTTVAAIEGLTAFRAKEAFDDLYALATKDDVDAFITKKAIIALGEIGDERAIPGLMKRMYTERPGVSFYAESSFSLYQIGAPAVPALLGALNENDKTLMAWAKERKLNPAALPLKAAQVLGDLHEPKAVKALEQMVQSKSEFDDVRSLLKMRGADALGRLRSRDSVKIIAQHLNEEVPAVRKELTWALTRIGGRDALPKLVESAAKGTYDARLASLSGLCMLGDERELAAVDKVMSQEASLLDAECDEVDNEAAECKAKPATVKKRAAAQEKLKAVLAAAKECKSDAQAWSKKLDDKEPAVRARAAYEIGRSNTPALVPLMMSELSDEDLDARLAAIQGVDWLVSDNAESAKLAKQKISELEAQLEREKGQTQYAKTNEDLRRLLTKIRR